MKGAAALALLLVAGFLGEAAAQPLPPEVPSGLPDSIFAPPTRILVRWRQPSLSHRYREHAYSFEIVSSIPGTSPVCVPGHGALTYETWLSIPPGTAWGEGDWIRMRAFDQADCTNEAKPEGELDPLPEDLISGNAYVLPEPAGDWVVMAAIAFAAWRDRWSTR